MQNPLRKNRCATKARAGAAAVELAVCVPIFLLILVATLDVCGMFHVQQSLKVAAYEGARTGIAPRATAESVHLQCETLLESLNVNDFTVTMDPPDLTNLESGDYFTVSISANFDANAFAKGLYLGKVLTKSATLKVD